MSKLNGADIPLPAAIGRRVAKRNTSDKPKPAPKPKPEPKPEPPIPRPENPRVLRTESEPEPRIGPRPKSKDERSDDIVIKSRPSPIKSKAQPIRTMRELSDVANEPKPKHEREHRRGLCPEPQMGRVSFTDKLMRYRSRSDPELSDEELPPIPMMTMTPINPPVRDRKREKHEYQQLKVETDMAQSRLHYGTLERIHKTKSDMQRQALSKYVEDRRDERRHREELERQALTKDAHDRMDKRRHREELDRLMYRDRSDERMHRERLEHDMMDHFASDRSDERRFALDRMRIKHVEPLTKANIMTRQQSLLEQEAALDRHIKRRERNNQLIAANQAYQAVANADKFEHVLREFGIETLHHDDVYVSQPVEESYMLGRKHYTYSILCIGVKDVLWNEDDDLIVIKLIDGSQRVIPLNNQVYRTERYYNGTIIVIRFYRYIHVGETKRNRRGSCPFCPNCEIA